MLRFTCRATMGRLSRKRDAYEGAAFAPSAPDRFAAELPEFINGLNEQWVAATRRISPRLPVELLRTTGEATQRHFESPDLYATGDAVSWAGPRPAAVWLDIAREYTERWLHQQQIRDATRRPGLRERRSFGPVLETFVRAPPHTFREVPGADGTHVHLRIHGEAGGEWSPVRADGRWRLVADVTSPPDALSAVDRDTVWRLFTKGISNEEAAARPVITGDRALGERVPDTVSVIA